MSCNDRVIRAYGCQVAVESNDAKIWALLPEVFPLGWKYVSLPHAERHYKVRVHSGRGEHVLFRGPIQVASSRKLKEIADALGRDLRLFVAERAKDRMFVHAAVLGWRGQAIVIPGKSMSGKSTLAAEFVRLGAVYYSDEYAVIDRHGWVYPYAKPLSLRLANSDRQTDFPVEKLGGNAGVRPLSIGLVLLTSYRASASWTPRKVSRSTGALALLSHTVGARRRPEKAVDFIRNAVESALVIKSRRGEAREVVRWTLGFDDSPSRRKQDLFSNGVHHELTASARA